jgi:hypothetical protein
MVPLVVCAMPRPVNITSINTVATNARSKFEYFTSTLLFSLPEVDVSDEVSEHTGAPRSETPCPCTGLLITFCDSYCCNEEVQLWYQSGRWDGMQLSSVDRYKAGVLAICSEVKRFQLRYYLA